VGKRSKLVQTLWKTIWRFLKELKISWALVAHSCNPSYLGGWDWDNYGLRLAWANVSWDSISKLTRTKWSRVPTLEEWGPKFKPQSHQKNPKNRPIQWCHSWAYIQRNLSPDATKTLAYLSIVALFRIAKLWNQPRSPSTVRLRKCDIYTQ
jgi:hypothetical protein